MSKGKVLIGLSGGVDSPIISYYANSNNFKTFSIIIPVLNSKAKLIRTIESIKKQNFNDYEVIVIDGGSNDGTQEYLESDEDMPLSGQKLLELYPETFYSDLVRLNQAKKEFTKGENDKAIDLLKLVIERNFISSEPLPSLIISLMFPLPSLNSSVSSGSSSMIPSSIFSWSSSF